MAKQSDIKKLVQNRRARHDYKILDVYEAGIELRGTEVKSVKNGKANIAEAYGRIENGECFLFNMHISPYEQGNQFNHDPLRPKRLLLNKREIRKIYEETQIRGKTLVPLALYLRNGWVKVELAIAEGKKLYDKRESAAKKDAERKARRAEKDRRYR
ncbi:MAG: SsrA-binding protein SmpB [Clostridia bacterium]